MVSAYMHLIDPPSGSGCKKFKPSQVFFCGDSAGGNLALTTALWIRDSGICALPAGLILLSPWMDLTHSMPSYKDHHAFDYLPDKSEDPAYISPDRSHYCVSTNSLLNHSLISPLFASESPESPLPPILIQVGDAEKLRDENLAFYASSFPTSDIRLEMYEDMVHVFQLLAPVDSFCQRGIDRIGKWLDGVLKDSEASQRRECLWIRRKQARISLQVSELSAIISSANSRT